MSVVHTQHMLFFISLAMLDNGNLWMMFAILTWNLVFLWWENNHHELFMRSKLQMFQILETIQCPCMFQINVYIKIVIHNLIITCFQISVTCHLFKNLKLMLMKYIITTFFRLYRSFVCATKFALNCN